MCDLRAEYYRERTHRDTVSKGAYLLKEYLEAGWIQKPIEIDNTPTPSKKSISVNGDGSQSSEGRFEVDDEDSLRDPNYLLELHGYDSTQWELVNSKSSHWDIRVKSGNITKLYSSKVVVKPIKEIINLEYAKQVFQDMCNDYKPMLLDNIQTKITNGKMLEVALFDFHFGKMCWAPECGENFDYKIAKQRFKNLITDIIKKANGNKYEKVLFVYSQDFFHFDGISSSTTAGTVVDTDLRWQKLYKIGCELLVWGIDQLTALGNVHTFYICSNHDETTSFYASNHLEAWYRNSDNVFVDSSPIGRKYIEFGKSLIAFTHGDKEGKRLVSLMPIEQPEAWSRCPYREWHCGHYHSEITKEDGGVIIRYISSPTSTDGWHFRQGFVGAIKKSQCFVWDKEFGNEEIWNIGIR